MGRNRRRFTVLVFVLSLLMLSSCSNRLQVQETGSPQQSVELEVVHLNNCFGKASLTQTLERSETTVIEAGAELGFDTTKTRTAIAGRYTTNSSQSKSLSVTAPPGAKRKDRSSVLSAGSALIDESFGAESCACEANVA